MQRWVELFPPYSEDCSVEEPGWVNFDGPLVLTIEYEGTIPVDQMTWTAIKVLYR